MDVPAEEFGPYLVYEQLGVGGMASVHRAETQGLAGFRRTVALKRMLPHVAADASLVKSFVREARLASHLHHTNVAQTFELGKVGDIYFMAMELVTGRNLREILRHCASTTGLMPLPIALNILNQICDALDYAHNLCDETGQPLGIIHRDVSPSNIIVSDGGVVKLIDFGIAKASAAGMQTMSGTIKGKFGYMAPEYIAGKIDARADLFALGVIAHELLTNRELFQGKDDMDTLNRVRGMPLVPPSQHNPAVPFEIDAIVMTALERDPDKRWQRATALRTALTTETKRLGLAALNNQVVEWIEWAFQQTNPGDTPSPLLEATTSQGGPMRPGRAPSPSPGDSFTSEDLEKTSLRPSAPYPQQGPDAPTGLHRPASVGPRRSSQQPVEPAPRRSSQQPVEPAPRRSSQQPVEPAPRRSSQPPAERRPPSVAPPGQNVRPPILSVPSGARTIPQIPAIPLGDSSVIEEKALGEALSGLEEKSSVTTSPMPLGPRVPKPPQSAESAAMTRHAEPRPRRGRGVGLVVLMLLAAAGTAAVVYFALPYLT